MHILLIISASFFIMTILKIREFCLYSFEKSSEQTDELRELKAELKELKLDLERLQKK